MTTTKLPLPGPRVADSGSAAGFVWVALAAVVAALGVVQLELSGGPWAGVQPMAPSSLRPSDAAVRTPGSRSAQEAGALRAGTRGADAPDEARLYKVGSSPGS